MYGKIFRATFNGSMAGAGPTVFAVWAYILAHTESGSVVLRPEVLSRAIGAPAEDIKKAIEYLASPDPKSRSRAHQGRRIIKLDGHRYRVPNHAIYRDIHDEEQLRDYYQNPQSWLLKRAPRGKSTEGKNGDNEKAEGPPPPELRKQLDALMDAWNKMAGETGLPKVRVIKAGTTRYKSARRRLAEKDWAKHYLKALGAIPQRPFLLGHNSYGWRASFDWFVKPQSVDKILEGVYDGPGRDDIPRF